MGGVAQQQTGCTLVGLVGISQGAEEYFFSNMLGCSASIITPVSCSTVTVKQVQPCLLMNLLCCWPLLIGGWTAGLDVVHQLNSDCLSFWTGQNLRHAAAREQMHEHRRQLHTQTHMIYYFLLAQALEIFITNSLFSKRTTNKKKCLDQNDQYAESPFNCIN